MDNLAPPSTGHGVTVALPVGVRDGGGMNDKLMAARYGVFRDSEAASFGIGRDRTGAAKGYRMVRGIRCLLPPPWSAEARFTAAVLAGGEDALLTGDSWLQAMGVESLRPLAPVNVWTRQSAERVDSRLAFFQRTRVLEPAGPGERGRLTCPLATDIGIASARSVVTALGAAYVRSDLRGVAATLIQRGITTADDVHEWTGLHPKLPGAALARQVAVDLGGGADSEGEFQFLELAKAVGMPPDRGHVEIRLTADC